MVKQSDAGASGGRFVTNTSANAGYARFTVTIPKDGTYVVWGRVQAPTDSDDSFYVPPDNGAQATSTTWPKGSGRRLAVDGRQRPRARAARAISPRKFTLTAGNAHLPLRRARGEHAASTRSSITDDLAYIPQIAAIASRRTSSRAGRARAGAPGSRLESPSLQPRFFFAANLLSMTAAAVQQRTFTTSSMTALRFTRERLRKRYFTYEKWHNKRPVAIRLVVHERAPAILSWSWARAPVAIVSCEGGAA